MQLQGQKVNLAMTGFPLNLHFHIPCIFPVHPQMFPLPIYVIYDYNTYTKLTWQTYIQVKKNWGKFSRQISQYPLPLSLYSTVTQNTWRRGLALGNAPDARIWRWGYQHVGILEPTQTLKLAFSPTRNPNASQWNIGGVGSSGVGHVYFMYISCTFHVVCASFSALATRELADANTIFSGIWALESGNLHLM